MTAGNLLNITTEQLCVGTQCGGGLKKMLFKTLLIKYFQNHQKLPKIKEKLE